MKEYSFLTNLRYMGWAIAKPFRLIDTLPEIPSAIYGVIPLIIYLILCEIGWISAYLSHAYNPISPLPKLLPISNHDYPLFMAVFGPIVKGIAVFIFLGVFKVFNGFRSFQKLPPKELGIFYLIVSFSLAAIAVGIDQIIFWGGLSENQRFLVSLIHPLVFLLAVIYVIMFVHKRAGISILRSIVLVVPSMIVSGPIPGLLFQ